MINDNFKKFKNAIVSSLQDNSFIKITLSNYKGLEENLKNIYVKKVLIKKEEQLSFTYRYQTKDITKNHQISDALLLISSLLTQNGFKIATLFTKNFDAVLEMQKNNTWALKQLKPSLNAVESLHHDKIKNRKIEAVEKKYLYELNITDVNGTVLKAAQDKFKQINHYVEVLSSLLKELPERTITNVVDMGAGKGYLTFALYDYLTNILNKPSNIIGVEFRQDLVDLCNKIAKNANFNNLHFEQGTIDNYDNNNIHILIALHACDTATDDAIYKGIINNADLIVVAPCCHKQIRREIEKQKCKNELDFITKYGIFLERQAEMVTDGIRSLILEYFGYSTKIFEFVTDLHTPKNIMIVGTKKKNSNENKQEILQKIKDTKAYFGILNHHLATKMGLV